MSEWRDYYKQENWKQREEERKKGAVVVRLRAEIQNGFDKLAYAKTLSGKKIIIRGIVRNYDGLKYEGKYTEEDEIEYQKLMEELQDIEYRIKKEMHDRNPDSKSWKEYQEEEAERD